MPNRCGRWLRTLPVLAAAVWLAGCAAREGVKGAAPPGAVDDPELTQLRAEVQRLKAENEELRKTVEGAIQRSAEEREASLDAERELEAVHLRVKQLVEELKAKEMQRPPGWPPEPFAAARRINCVVTDVRGGGDEVWVQLGAGNRNGVQEGTLFIIYGEDAYKGDMVVTTVFPDICIGRLTVLGTKHVVKGDRATTSLADD